MVYYVQSRESACISRLHLAIKNGRTWQDMLSLETLTPLFQTDSLRLTMRIAKIMIMEHRLCNAHFWGIRCLGDSAVQHSNKVTQVY